MLDLDKGNVKEFNDNDRFDHHSYLPKMIYQYKLSDVDNKLLTKIHIRGKTRNKFSADGSLEDSNEKIVIFALHENYLYNFTLMNESEVEHCCINFVCKVKSKIFQNKNDEIFYMLQEFTDKDSIARKQIIKFKISFTEYRSEIVYQDDPSQFLIDFKLDDSQDKLILLSKPFKKERN